MERYFEINENGHNVRCKLYCNDLRGIRRVVVFCHGFGGHKDNSAAEKFAQRMVSKYRDTALVTFNWPSHGDDVKKKISLDDCGAYLELVVAHLRQKYGPELYAYATSFGGYLTLKYIGEKGNPFRKIVLRCPAVDMYQVLTRTIIGAGELDRLRKGKDASVGFDRKVPVSAGFLRELQEKDIRKTDYLDYAEDILILHGTADEIVPIETVESFCEEQLIEFVPVEGADHRFRDPRKMDQAIKTMLEFLF
jgi:alpha-beta hydrolase superfamily lysophospholipase